MTIIKYLNVNESGYNFFALIGLILFPTNFNGKNQKYLRALFPLWSDGRCRRLHACLMRTTRVEIDEIIVGIIYASLNV